VRERLQAAWSWQLSPVAVAWDGRAPAIELRLPESATGRVEIELHWEDGQTLRKACRLADLPLAASSDLEGQRFVSRRLDLAAAGLVDRPLSFGYHELALTAGERRLQCCLISAPRRFYAPPPAKQWGSFLPVYSLHSRRSWGVGDLTDLESLVDLTAREGGSFVGTLPILASFLETPCEPSPYSPVSRLFWNELYADPQRPFPGAGPKVALPPEAERLNVEALVPYREAMALKRRAFSAQAAVYLATAAGRVELDAFCARKPARWSAWAPAGGAGRIASVAASWPRTTTTRRRQNTSPSLSGASMRSFTTLRRRRGRRASPYTWTCQSASTRTATTSGGTGTCSCQTCP
jgi:4-alpha-glucanotransferase